MEVAVVKIDLCSKDGVRVLLNQLNSNKRVVVWLAPPCGTFSRARERPVPVKLKRMGAPEPQPLRDATFPMGFPDLTGSDREKVGRGNTLADIAAMIAQLC